ncbi:MAG: hypothetical protein QHH09_04270 [Microgenomates group bacterium]|nr:hypothetical protein [Microgenomates group bacterium]
MKKKYHYFIWLLFFVLFIANIYIFVCGIKLSNEINYYETEISKYSLENKELEKKVYDLSSLKYAASMAAELNFVVKAKPLFLENIKYALNH